jgi:hypothetical protein
MDELTALRLEHAVCAKDLEVEKAQHANTRARLDELRRLLADVVKQYRGD